MTVERVAALDRAKMMAFYRQRFSNAKDFTFFMVGAFKIDDALPLLGRYVGSLPSTGQPPAAFTDLHITFPSRIERAKVEKGREPQSQTVISFFAEPDPTPLEQERVIEATSVLELGLRDILRAELGQTYSVGVGLAQPLPQRGSGHIEVRFGSAPENVDAMVDRVLKEIKRLQEEESSADLTNRAKQSARSGYETSLRENGYWLRRLATIHMIGGDPNDILTRKERIDSITTTVVQDTFKKYFPLDRFTVVTLMPAPVN
jgi:zinc protease